MLDLRDRTVRVSALQDGDAIHAHKADIPRMFKITFGARIHNFSIFDVLFIRYRPKFFVQYTK